MTDLLDLTVTVSPAERFLTLPEGEKSTEVVKVGIPAAVSGAKVDVYFLADTTGSMNPALAAVRDGLSTILAAVGELGTDVAFGVGNYKDFPAPAARGHPFAFQHQCSLTSNHDDVHAGIDGWKTTPGRDTPEAQLYALDHIAQPPGGRIGWRAGARRIVVWFGDAAGHDPVCKEITGLTYDITEASVTEKLRAERIAVLALSMSTNYRAPAGLDDDPTTHATGYKSKCGAPGGEPGQGTRIADATGGTLVRDVTADSIVQVITEQVAAQVSTIRSLRLVAVGAVVPFVSGIEPAEGHGPVRRDRARDVSFGVSWLGTVPCTHDLRSFGGSLDVHADGAVAGAQAVKISVPACAEAAPAAVPEAALAAVSEVAPAAGPEVAAAAVSEPEPAVPDAAPATVPEPAPLVVASEATPVVSEPEPASVPEPVPVAAGSGAALAAGSKDGGDGGEPKAMEEAMAGVCLDEVGGSAGVAGIYVGVVTGAQVGTVALPIPLIGTLVGAVAGGILGRKAGELTGRFLCKGTSALAGAMCAAAPVSSKALAGGE